MNEPMLITEGQDDVTLLRSILDDGAMSAIKYISAGGWSGADALARSYLTDPDVRVAVVVDADTLDANGAAERKRFLERSLGQIAPHSRWCAVVVVPEIEALLFENRSMIEGLLGKPVDPTEFVRGKYEPKTVLSELMPGVRLNHLYSRLASVDLSALRNRPEIEELSRFLLNKRRKVAV
jgi:hypothetical protein